MALIDLTKTKKGRKQSLNAPAENPEETATATTATAPEPTAPVAPAVPAPRPAAGGDDLSQLREIVFGPQLGELREDFARLENRSALESTKLRDEIQSLSRRLDERITELDARTTKTAAETATEFIAQQKALTASIEEAGQQAVDLVNKGLQELREQSVDRTSLSKIFLDLASEIDRGLNA